MFIIIVGVIGIIGGLATFAGLFQNTISRINLKSKLKVRYFIPWSFRDGLITHFSKGKTVKEYFYQKQIIQSADGVSISLENISGAGTIKIAAFVYIHLYRAVKIPNRTAFYFEPKDGIGGGGEPRPFWGVLTPESSEFSVAGYLSQDFKPEDLTSNPQLQANFKRQFGYFSIAPGEFESIDLSLKTLDGYYYEFRVGIPFEANGMKHTFWIDNDFIIANPIKTKYYKPLKINPWQAGEEYGDLATDYENYGIIPWLNDPVQIIDRIEKAELNELNDFLRSTIINDYPLRIRPVRRIVKSDQEIFASLELKP